MIIDKSNVKSKFETGDVPTQQDFIDFIDSVNVPLVNVVGSVSSNVITDVSNGDVFDLVLTDNITLDKPTGPIDGKAITWLFTQGDGGSKTVTLDSSFVIPSTATSPLSFSNVAGKTDIFVARYNQAKDKWMVVSMVSGYDLN